MSSPRSVTSAGTVVVAIVVVGFGLASCAGTGTTTPSYVDAVPSDGVPSDGEEARSASALPPPSALPDAPGIDDLIRYALAASPRIAAAQGEAGAAAGRAWERELWPNPTLRVEARDVPTDRYGSAGPSGGREDFGRGERWLTVMQPVSVSGRRGAAQEAAREDLAAASSGIEAVRRRVAADVASAWAEAAFAQRRTVLAADAARAAAQTAAIAGRRVESGTLAAPDALGVRREAEMLAVDAARARRDEESALAALTAVVGSAPVLRVRDGPVAHTPLPTRAEITRAALDGNPVLEAARRRVSAAARRVDEAVAGRVPDIDVMLAVGRDEAGGAKFIEAGVSVPLPVFNRNQGMIREARGMLAAAQGELADAERSLASELVAAFAAHAAAADEVAAWRDRLVPLAKEAETAARSAFAQGTRSEEQTLAAERARIEAELALAKAERDLRIAETGLRSYLPLGDRGRGAKSSGDAEVQR
jgi:cobalt-zinc-cadmium efflux system outer membrane protein